MGTTPTTDNQAADILNAVISALMSGGVAAAEAYLTALAPEVMALPVVGWLIDEGISYLAQAMSIATQKMADALVIDIQTNGEKSGVINATTALQFALASGDASAIAGATAAASAAWGSLIHLDGWSTPT